MDVEGEGSMVEEGCGVEGGGLVVKLGVMGRVGSWWRGGG